MALYEAGHRHFGENYIQELSEKAAIVSYPPKQTKTSSQQTSTGTL